MAVKHHYSIRNAADSSSIHPLLPPKLSLFVFFLYSIYFHYQKKINFFGTVKKKINAANCRSMTIFIKVIFWRGIRLLGEQEQQSLTHTYIYYDDS